MGPSAPPYLHRFRLGSRRSLMTNAPLVPGFRDAALSDDSGSSPLFSVTHAPLSRRRRETSALRRLCLGVGRLRGGGRRGVQVKLSRWSGEAE